MYVTNFEEKEAIELMIMRFVMLNGGSLFQRKVNISLGTLMCLFNFKVLYHFKYNYIQMTKTNFISHLPLTVKFHNSSSGEHYYRLNYKLTKTAVSQMSILFC